MENKYQGTYHRPRNAHKNNLKILLSLSPWYPTSILLPPYISSWHNIFQWVRVSFWSIWGSLSVSSPPPKKHRTDKTTKTRPKDNTEVKKERRQYRTRKWFPFYTWLFFLIIFFYFMFLSGASKFPVVAFQKSCFESQIFWKPSDWEKRDRSVSIWITGNCSDFVVPTTPVSQQTYSEGPLCARHCYALRYSRKQNSFHPSGKV